MFVRTRQARSRIQLSVIATRRVDRKVRHQHLAGLAIDASPTVADRVDFWRKLHERLGRLANRVDATAQAKILGEVHARIPMPTVEEIRSVQLENAEARRGSDIDAQQRRSLEFVRAAPTRSVTPFRPASHCLVAADVCKEKRHRRWRALSTQFRHPGVSRGSRRRKGFPAFQRPSRGPRCRQSVGTSLFLMRRRKARVGGARPPAVPASG